MSDINGKVWAWRLVQAVAGMLLLAVSITTPLAVSAVSDITSATAKLNDRVTTMEANRFTLEDGHSLQRQIDTKADMAHCAAQWATVTDRLNDIHRLVVRLEERAAAAHPARPGPP